jgi:hypothetical protein
MSRSPGELRVSLLRRYAPPDEMTHLWWIDAWGGGNYP